VPGRMALARLVFFEGKGGGGEILEDCRGLLPGELGDIFLPFARGALYKVPDAHRAAVIVEVEVRLSGLDVERASISPKIECL
jgi:hypothetical protein